MPWRKPNTPTQTYTWTNSTVSITSHASSQLTLLPWITLISSSPVHSKKSLGGKLCILWTVGHQCVAVTKWVSDACCVVLQQGHCWAIRVPHCIYPSWALPCCTWHWCFWSQVQYRLTWSRHECLLPVHRNRQETHCLPPWDWGAPLQWCWELWAQVSTEINLEIFQHSSSCLL